ncbi:MAG: hypothetical protein Q9208_001362 [Pyrenodesmia sp. 3 TL-2023]
MTTTNYSVYSIPIYFLMNFAPHVYSVALITNRNPARYNNVNPKASSNLDSFRKRATAATYSRWERARAAHSNGYESLPLLVAAVVLGNMAKLDAGTMNWAFGAFLVLRAAYIVAYIKIETQHALERGGTPTPFVGEKRCWDGGNEDDNACDPGGEK